MLTYLRKKSLQISSMVTVGLMASMDTAQAGAGAGSNTNFGSIAENIVGSVQNLPGLLSSLSYLTGLLLGVLGILKIKDHVENPQQTQLKDGAVRLAAGGGLFALPIVYDAMLGTIGNDGAGVDVPEINAASWSMGGSR